MRVTWAAALAWRLRRHHLEPGHQGRTVEDVVERLVAVPAWSGDPDLAIGTRLADSQVADLDTALAAGRVIKVFAFRGATHLMTPERAADHLALRAASRMWERSSWRSHYNLEAEDWPLLRAAVRDALSDGPLTSTELATAVAAEPRFSHLREELSRLDTLLKPFFWQGDVCFGPPREGVPTLQRLADNARWPGIPDLDEAGRRAVSAYLATYGPASPTSLQYWLGEGLGSGRRRIQDWIADLQDRTTSVEVGGAETLILSEHAEELASTQQSGTVKLLAGHDQWVLGPGTADSHVVPPAHRAEVSRGANLVILGGVVCGTWRARGGRLDVSPWDGVALPVEELALEEAWVGQLRAG